MEENVEIAQSTAGLPQNRAIKHALVGVVIGLVISTLAFIVYEYTVREKVMSPSEISNNSNAQMGQDEDTSNSSISNSQDSTVKLSEGDVVSAYLSSPLRVMGAFRSENIGGYPTPLAGLVQLVVATDRTTDNGNDEICGSIYSQSTCYFFIEPRYIKDAPPREYIGKLEYEGAFLTDSVKFIEPDIVEFKTADGDGGYGFRQTWRLNLTTKEFTKMQREEFGG